MKTVQRDILWARTPAVNAVGENHNNRLLLEPGHWEEYDPFLLLAEDWFVKGSFGLHPHRGMETVTYIIEGKLDHFDNNGGKDELLAGDAQWMTAGRGVIHLEDPAEGISVHSYQLWINLASDKKLTKPRYQNLRSAHIPIRQEKGATARVFSGSSAGITAPTQNHTPVTMIEFNLEAGATIVQDLPGSYNGFLIVVEGEGVFGNNRMVGVQGQVLWLGSGVGDAVSGVTVTGDAATTNATSEIVLEATSALRVLLYAGQPLGEPVVARGPFVMNTDAQIQEAYQDYRDGKFQ
jgi:redox-sensitive bicupin YhaK (pirin superfamily)